MASRKTGNRVRGSTTGRPIMVLFDVLGQRWNMRVLWELRQAHMVFRELQQRCGDVSPTVLNNRLKTLRELELVEHVDGRGYGLTEDGASLGTQLLALHEWAERWAKP